jgi:hypothetical protein
MIGQSSFGVGDINLAAAIATMGVSPDPTEPIKLIARDNGKDYTRFHFRMKSICGKYDTHDLSAAWTNHDNFNRENPNHPFAWLMDFIATKPRGCVNADDWQVHAAAFLELPIDAVRKLYAKAAQTCSASPESKASYVVAFIRNRCDMIHAAKHQSDNGNFKTLQDRNKSVLMLPAKAPSRIKDFLLSHLR